VRLDHLLSKEPFGALKSASCLGKSGVRITLEFSFEVASLLRVMLFHVCQLLRVERNGRA
jgi:hypothetical protein